MDINPTFNYKNAEIELVVEDDIITTAKVIWMASAFSLMILSQTQTAKT